MRAQEFLLEYRRDVTIQNLGDRLYNTFTREGAGRIRRVFGRDIVNEPKEQVIQELLAKLERADPTANKQYVQWMARTYLKGDTFFEDVLSQVAGYLSKFYQLVQRKMIAAPRNDINGYKNFGDFMNSVEQYPDIDAKGQTDKGLAKAYYEDSEIRVIVPLDRQAACYYGQGTRWCTAGQNHNMFDRYASYGTLYIIIPKRPKIEKGEKYQFHFETDQYMDPRDDPVNLRNLVVHYPSLKKAFAQQAKTFMVPDLMDTDTARQFVSQAKTDIESSATRHPGGILSWSLNLMNSAEGFNKALTRKLYATTGQYLHDTADDADLANKGDLAWALLDTGTGSVNIVKTSFDTGEAFWAEDFSGSIDQENYGTDMIKTRQDLLKMLYYYLELLAAENTEYDDQEEAEADPYWQALQANPNAADVALDEIYKKYGYPADWKDYVARQRT
jgi:hypothetical protein